jgi:hypothetical protein
VISVTVRTTKGGLSAALCPSRVLDQRPVNGLSVVRRHTVAFRDWSSRRRIILGSPDATLWANFPSVTFGADWSLR